MEQKAKLRLSACKIRKKNKLRKSNNSKNNQSKKTTLRTFPAQTEALLKDNEIVEDAFDIKTEISLTQKEKSMESICENSIKETPTIQNLDSLKTKKKGKKNAEKNESTGDSNDTEVSSKLTLSVKNVDKVHQIEEVGWTLVNKKSRKGNLKKEDTKKSKVI